MPYPRVAVYTGAGTINDAENFVCRARHSLYSHRSENDAETELNIARACADQDFPNCGAFTVTLDVLPRLRAGVLEML